jgi:lipid-binding SYLF domain-containing protein
MFKIRAKTAAALFVWFTMLLSGCASTATHEETKTTVAEAQTTLSNFLRDPDMTWIQKNLEKAKAVLISPALVRAGFIVGAQGGNGVVMARGRSPHSWNGPAFYKIGAGSLGLQAGVDKSETVTLVMSEKGLASILSTSFKMGGDVSIATGPIGAGAGAPINADMVIFVRAKGLYGGINLNGTVISVDEEGNTAAYGQAASPIDILVEGKFHGAEGAGLRQVLEQADSGAR